MPEERTINIAGAGPSGLAAAIWLRRHGYGVRVFDKAPAAGSRFRGDFQGLENWTSRGDALESLREMGIEPDFPAVPYYGGTIFTRGAPPAEIKAQKPMFYLVRRGPVPGTLDYSLMEQAQAAGAELRFGHRLDSFEGMDVVGTGPAGLITLIAGVTFRTSAKDAAYALLGDEFAPGGYGYLLVCGGLATMATVLYRDFPRASECLRRTRAFFASRLPLDAKEERRFTGRINFFVRDSHKKGGTLYVGEAAGFQDCLWGFGMRYAMTSGHLAARSIVEGADYDSLWKKGLGPGLHASLVNRRLFEWLGRWGYTRIPRSIARSADPRESLMRQYRLSPLKRLLLPLCRGRFKAPPL
ncbi:MAG: NAD(P)/FAD-dependent oxidoreductase [Nitrospirota bacterium]